MPADLIFIIFGAIPFFIAACKTWCFYQRQGAPKNAEDQPGQAEAEATEEAV